MTIERIDDIVSGLAGASRQIIPVNKLAYMTSTGYGSCWLSGSNPPAGTTPPSYTSGGPYTCNKSTTGAAQFGTADFQFWIARLLLSFTHGGHIMQGMCGLADRLWACSGIGPAAGTYNINSPGNLPVRAGDKRKCRMCIEVYGACSDVTGTITINYVDALLQSRSTVVVPQLASINVRSMLTVHPAPNAIGVSQVTSVTLSNTWSAGNIGVTVFIPLFFSPMYSGRSFMVRDWTGTGLPPIDNDACLWFWGDCRHSWASSIIGDVILIDK